MLLGNKKGGILLIYYQLAKVKMAAKEIYEDGFVEYVDGGLREEKEGRYRCAVDLYYKAITQLCDYILLTQKNKISTSHSNRFRLLEELFPEIYQIIDDLFTTYTEVYVDYREKKHCEDVKNGIKKIISIAKIEGRIKAISEKL